jgi:hypothetical protein
MNPRRIGLVCVMMVRVLLLCSCGGLNELAQLRYLLPFMYVRNTCCRISATTADEGCL